jgi:predicted nuclease of predicted toxin-antitoxin system
MDEHIDPAITKGLRRIYPELDVVTVQETGLRTKLDDVLLVWAAQEGRVMVSRDLSTMELEASKRIRKGDKMTGVLLIRPGAGHGEAIRVLQFVIECAEPNELENAILYIPL